MNRGATGTGIREHLKPFYSETGRPSIDPELVIRMLIIGYCMGIRSERRLCGEVHLNLAYRWFCRVGFEGDVPDHSAFVGMIPNSAAISVCIRPLVSHSATASGLNDASSYSPSHTSWLRRAYHRCPSNRGMVNRADVLIGNPPWTVRRHLSADMKDRLCEALQSYNLWVGGSLATQQDMCALLRP